MFGIPRQHHFVTKAYLERFLRPGEKQLSCYARNRPAPDSAAPVNLANIRDYHSFRRKDGAFDHSLEDRIGREIESHGLPIMLKVSSGKLNLSYEERYKLIALQNIRVPYERNFIGAETKRSLLEFLSDMDQLAQRSGQPVNEIQVGLAPNDDPRRMTKPITLHRSAILARLHEMEEDPLMSSRQAIFALATEVAKELLVGTKWSIYYASGEIRFITSDRPVANVFPDGNSLGRGIKDLRCEILFPLSGTAVLQMSHHSWLVDAALRCDLAGHVFSRLLAD
jgi:hypothetical protein